MYISLLPSNLRFKLVLTKLFQLEQGDQTKVQGLKLSVLEFLFRGVRATHVVSRAASRGSICFAEQGVTLDTKQPIEWQ